MCHVLEGKGLYISFGLYVKGDFFVNCGLWMSYALWLRLSKEVAEVSEKSFSLQRICLKAEEYQSLVKFSLY